MNKRIAASVCLLLIQFSLIANTFPIYIASISEQKEIAGKNVNNDSYSNWKTSDRKVFKITNNNATLVARFAWKDFGRSSFYIESSNPNLDLLKVYINDSIVGFSGDVFKASQRHIHSAYPTVKIQGLSTGDSVKIEMRMDEDFIIPLVLHDEESYIKTSSKRNLFIGLYIGILGAILIYNFLLYLSIRNRLLLFYCFYILFVALTQLSIYSNYTIYLFPESVFLAKRDVFIFSSILGIACAPFIISILRLQPKSIPYRVVIFLSLCYAASFLLSLTHLLRLNIQVLSVLNFISSAYILTISLYLIKRVKITKYFLLAWAVFLVGAIIFILTNYCFIPYNLMLFHLMPIGTAIEAMLLSLALGYRVNLLIKDNKKKDAIIKKQEKIISKLNKQTKYSELAILNGHMKPHFLFNAVTSVQSYIQNNNRERSVHYLARYSKLMRYNLEIADKEYIELEDELNFLNNYIEMEDLRLENSVHYTCNLDLRSDIEDILIPPMFLQPLVENSFKHGFKKEIKSPEIIINVKEEEDDIIIEVIDNGVGFNSLKKETQIHSSYALRNIERRLIHLNREFRTLRYDISFESKPHIETKVKLILPIIPS